MPSETHTFIMRVQFTGDFASRIDQTPGGDPPSLSVDKELRRVMCQLRMNSALPKRVHVWVAEQDFGRGTLEMRWETAANGYLITVFVHAFTALHTSPDVLDTHGIRRMLLYRFNRSGVTAVPKSWRPFFSAYNTAGKPPHDLKPINPVPRLPGPQRPSAPSAHAPPPLASPSISSISTPPRRPAADSTPSDIAAGLDARRDQDQLSAYSSSVLAAELVFYRERCDKLHNAVKAEKARALVLETLLNQTVLEKTSLAGENAIMRREVQALRDRAAQDEGAASLKRKRDEEVSQRSVRARMDDVPLKTEPTGDHDALHSVSALESRVRELRANLQSEVLARQVAEQRLRDMERECKEPFVVPAMLQAFLRLATIGDGDDWATNE